MATRSWPLKPTCWIEESEAENKSDIKSWGKLNWENHFPSWNLNLTTHWWRCFFFSNQLLLKLKIIWYFVALCKVSALAIAYFNLGIFARKRLKSWTELVLKLDFIVFVVIGYDTVMLQKNWINVRCMVYSYVINFRNCTGKLWYVQQNCVESIQSYNFVQWVLCQNFPNFIN